MAVFAVKTARHLLCDGVFYGDASAVIYDVIGVFVGRGQSGMQVGVTMNFGSCRTRIHANLVTTASCIPEGTEGKGELVALEYLKAACCASLHHSKLILVVGRRVGETYVVCRFIVCEGLGIYVCELAVGSLTYNLEGVGVADEGKLCRLLGKCCSIGSSGRVCIGLDDIVIGVINQLLRTRLTDGQAEPRGVVQGAKDYVCGLQFIYFSVG